MKSSRRRLLIICVSLMLGMLIMVAVAVMSYQANQAEARDNFEVIGRGDIQTTVMTTGVLQPLKKISVGAQVNGQLKKLYVKQGDKVDKGQLLAEIDPVIQKNELRNAEAELNSNRAQVQASKVLLRQYALTLKRQKKMALDGAGIPSDLESAQADYDMQSEQLQMDKSRLVQAEISVETARANLGYTRILAPIDGEVLGIIIQEGQTIVSSQTAPTLMVLADMSVMRVQTRISETDILKTHPGQPLWFYVMADPHRRYESIMGIIQDAPDEALRESNDNSGIPKQSAAVYYNGEFNIANDQRRLKTSMTAEVFIIVDQAKNVLRIPLSVVGDRDAQGRYQVQVWENGKITDRLLELGIRDNHYAEVKSGLAQGDQVLSALPYQGDADASQ
ncbi:efflux RND transporter periplasmic adaptor subunit [Rahnella sp. C60]|uniref:Efflux RND transporter periplasmic adaptor subunit n=3 Tax=Rahnella perminowiae TaxID=2816244 RepID=A0ABS6L214_9GAMM|nr:efflux RND transporter periplasmic adaptor subunit [Rahnella perminowiae]MBU9809736.1 efflux RND transporter periplasmic adaptor subunit [Rahnella perminowiae]MBU9817420.1 efflux RND transporter periplasmic adaptor subunit [Rahnella perminowiae]MBU9835861.1 efflux RND transporter periplasmic adaptor subunit [Rahnella perminowiae]UJD87349.1 efflux RND transporter periplasmic adaptor subunit [Rahnella aquatilis]